MKDPANGFEFLDQLRNRYSNQNPSFYHLTRFLEQKAREQKVAIRGQFELTPLCNFSCKMCYVHLQPEQMNGQNVLPVSIWKDLMHQAWEAGMFRVSLSGGECLAYPGFDEIFLYLHSLGCEVAVLTNGFLLDDKRIQFFQQHMPSRIQVTMYGWNDDVYERVTGQRAFHTVSENVRKAIDAGLPVTLCVTPSLFLGEDVLETVRTAKKMCKVCQVNSNIFTPRKETGRSEQKDDPEIEQYVKIYQLVNELDGREIKVIDKDNLPSPGGPNHKCDECGLTCGAGLSGFAIDWKGTMVACNRMEMIRAYPLKDGFRKAWAELNHQASEWPRVAECDGCAYREICNKCAANMLRFAKPGEQPTTLCEQTKYLVSQGVVSIAECD